VAAIRVLIVDDHALFVDALRPTLTRLGFDEIDHVTRGDEVLATITAASPTLALVDLGLPDRSGLSIGHDILETCPETKVVVLTALDDQRTVLRAIQAGFHGYLTKDTPVSSFGSAIRSVLDGQQVFPNVPRNGRSRGGPERDARMLAEQLTAREREVLSLLVQGVSGDSLSRRLGISPNTVRTHVQSILTKLQVHSRLEAATFAVRHGVTDAPARRAAG
jgi:two-component system, NarL family, nitrate/nitrite response regulator NarL